MTDSQQLEAETRALLSDWPSVIVQPSGGGWLVGIGSREGAIEHVGHTGIDPTTSDDPRDMALRLISIARPVAPEPVLPPIEDEDPGEQPEIFTEEDVEAAGAVAVESETAQEDDRPADTETPSELGTSGGVFYPGMLIQPPDEIYALRDFVRGRISEAKLIRLDAATDPSRWQTLNAYESQYNNLWRLKHELHGEAIVIPAEVMQGHEEYLLAFARRSAIESHALDLERRAATAEKATLDLMAADIWSGGP